MSGDTTSTITQTTFVDSSRTIQTYQQSLTGSYHTYQLTSGATDWLHAEQQAAYLGGSLVTINDATEQATVTGSYSNQSLWIGMNDYGYGWAGQEGKWVWDGVSTASYRNWAGGAPTSGSTYNYGYLSGSNGQWYADTASATRQGVVELDEKSQFMAAMRGQSKDAWNTAYTPDVINAYFRAGFTVSGSPTNAAPVVATNTGVTLAADKGIVLSAAMLNTTDSDGTAVNTVYLLETLPTHGTVRLNGQAMVLRQTFTQADINAGLMSYEHDSTSTADSFGFRVTDGKGGITVSTSFAVAIGTPATGSYTVTNAAPTVASSQTFHVTDSATSGTVIGTVSASDANTSQRLIYTITQVGSNAYDLDKDPIRINMFTGQLITQLPDATQNMNHKFTPSYTLTITVTDDGTIPQTTTQTVTVYADASASVATSLAVAQQPTTVTAGQSATFTVNVRDQYEDVMTGNTSNVTLAIQSGAPHGEISGTTTVAAVNGVATFNLSFTKAGDYTLKATSGTLTSVFTNAFTVSAAAASKLAMTPAPLLQTSQTSNTWGGGTSPLIGTNEPSTSAFPVTAGANKVLVLEVSGQSGTPDSAGTITYGGLPMTLAGYGAQSGLDSRTTFSSIYYLDLTGASLSSSSFAGQVLAQSASNYNAYNWVAQAIVLSNVDVTKLPTVANGRAAGVEGYAASLTATVTTAVDVGSFALIGSSGSSKELTDSFTWLNNTSSVDITSLTQAPELGAYYGTSGRQGWSGIGYLLNLPASSSLGVTATLGHLATDQTTALAVAVFSPIVVTKVAGQTIVPGFAATVQDQYGNTVTTNSSNVTIATNTGPGTLSGTTTIAAVNGIATFSNLSLTTAGSYTIKVTDGALTLATSGSFSVSAGIASQLLISQQPTNVIQGQIISPAVTVQVTDQYGNVVTSDNSNITMAVNTGPGALSGTLTVAAVNGVATFSNLSLTTAG
ncbi:MAG: cadherin-like domain-containing protein, partial [Phycisphaerae bacterium]